MINASIQNKRSKNGNDSIEACKPGYNVDEGIANTIDDTAGGDHAKITNMQRKFVEKLKAEDRKPTVLDSIQQMNSELDTIENPPLTLDEKLCLNLAVLKMLAEKCPGLIADPTMRRPYQKEIE